MRAAISSWFATATLIMMASFVGKVEASSSSCFADDFLIGSATASYQVEGGWNETGRTPSIWDTFCQEDPDRACAKVADDFLHRYQEDVDRMSDMGLQSFRFSVSWSRVMTWNGTNMVPNPEGMAFYHDLIRALSEKSIEPLLTMYHWDLPMALHENLDPPGWLSSEIVTHFGEYAAYLYDELGGKIRYWATFNEPWTFSVVGYGSGGHAPGMNNSDTNTYAVAHHTLLSHAVVVEDLRERRRRGAVREDAKIGIVLNCDASLPLDPDDPDDVAAAERGTQFALGWFLDPIVSGDYPAVMRERAGDRLPTFTPEQSALVRGSYDLFMLNHYGTHAVTSCDSDASLVPCDKLDPGWARDMGNDGSRFPDGTVPSSPNAKGVTNCGWFGAYPKGYLAVIRWMHQKDPDAHILLTENGFCGNATVDNEDQLWYYQSYLAEVAKGVNEENLPIVGYTAWSLVDNYEWGSYEPRFGLFYVDYPPEVGSHEGYTPTDADLKRVPRPAADFVSRVAKTRCVSPDDQKQQEESSKKLSFGTRVWNWTVRFFFVGVAVVIGTVVGTYVKNLRSGYTRI